MNLYRVNPTTNRIIVYRSTSTGDRVPSQPGMRDRSGFIMKAMALFNESMAIAVSLLPPLTLTPLERAP